MYKIILSERVIIDLAKLKKSEPSAFKKVEKLLVELAEHPCTGTGQVERLKFCTEETWSRRINKEHRIVYRVYDAIVEVYVLSAFGHYE